MIRTLLVEDEPLARDLVRACLAHHPDIDLVGEAQNGRQGLALSEQLRPDLILLDIRMPELDGLSLARQLPHEPALIFLTAWERYAVTAFELGAFDYLLKPIEPNRLAAALARVRSRLVAGGEPLSQRLGSVASPGYLQHFFLRHLGTVVPVHVPEIIRLEAADDYTAVHLRGRHLLAHIPLRDLTQRLDPARFVRVHRCHVVHLAAVRACQPEPDRRLRLRLSDGSEVTTSRAGAQLLQSFRF